MMRLIRAHVARHVEEGGKGKMWDPLNRIAKAVDPADEANRDATGTSVDLEVASNASEVLVSLQLLLLCLARIESQMSGNPESDEHRQLLERLRQEWFADLEIRPQNDPRRSG